MSDLSNTAAVVPQGPFQWSTLELHLLIKSMELTESLLNIHLHSTSPEISEILRVTSRRHTRQKGPFQAVAILDYRIGRRV